jgi:putative 4-mercaptohistidine N1-methyltranferase
MNSSHSGYESEELLSRYLLFHYGAEQDQLPFSFGPHDSLHFPVRCVTECLAIDVLPSDAAAIDLGCAVGRSSFELSRHCKRVVGIDASHRFIQTAIQLQEQGEVPYQIVEEGNKSCLRTAVLPAGVKAQAVEFRCCDAMQILQESIQYDVVLAANLICRLPDPKSFLKALPNILKREGQLILLSPYSWLEEFTQSSRWLNSGSSKNSLETMKMLFGKKLRLMRAFDMPFLLREHQRKYEWCVSQASLWRKS